MLLFTNDDLVVNENAKYMLRKEIGKYFELIMKFMIGNLVLVNVLKLLHRM